MTRLASTFSNGSARRGAITPWVALSMTVIVGIVAFGMDGGRMYQERRQAQAAADAAALAAANLLYENYSDWKGKDYKGQAADAARASALANGYDNNTTTNTVAVNIPPKSGAFAGKDDYVEVIIESNLSASFSRVFAADGLPVKARATARGRPRRLGMIALHRTSVDAVSNKALGTFTVLNAPIIVNSSDASALHNFSLLPVIAPDIDIVGNYVNAGGLIVGNIRTGVEPTADPLEFLPEPDPAAYVQRSGARKIINAMLPLPITFLDPGVYVGGIEVSGLSTVVMRPGVYIMDGGGLEIKSGAVLGLGGVTIFNGSFTTPAGPIKINQTGVNALTLVPPMSGTYRGISIFQQRGLASKVELSSAGAALITGVVYAPNAPVALTGDGPLGVDVLGGAVIADTISVGGLGSVTLNLGWNFPRIPDVNLVE